MQAAAERAATRRRGRRPGAEDGGRAHEDFGESDVMVVAVFAPPCRRRRRRQRRQRRLGRDARSDAGMIRNARLFFLYWGGGVESRYGS